MGESNVFQHLLLSNVHFYSIYSNPNRFLNIGIIIVNDIVWNPNCMLPFCNEMIQCSFWIDFLKSRVSFKLLKFLIKRIFYIYITSYEHDHHDSIHYRRTYSNTAYAHMWNHICNDSPWIFYFLCAFIQFFCWWGIINIVRCHKWSYLLVTVPPIISVDIIKYSVKMSSKLIL